VRLLTGCAVLIVALAAAATSTPTGAQTSPQARDPWTSVILLSVADPEKGYAMAYYGTAWFIGSDGLAITASHVVWHYIQEPGRYVLIALWGDEAYRADLVCAYPLGDDPPRYDSTFFRDIAEVRLTPWDGPADRVVFLRGNPDLTFPMHRGPLPAIPTLPVAARATSAGRVIVPGYGRVSGPLRLHVVRGLVAQSFDSTNGAPMLRLSLSQPILPGDSGAPIVNSAGEVIGVTTKIGWEPGAAFGVAASALRHPCQ
jgi:hypothetical protein